MFKHEEYKNYIIELENVNKIHDMKEYMQHGDFTTYDHCAKVAYTSFNLAKKLNLNLDYKSLVRGAFLHDFFLYDWHEKNDNPGLHAFTHPNFALVNSKKHFELNKKEENIIESHMWPVTITKLPKTKEAFIVCFVDKYCALVETIQLKKIFKNSVVLNNEE